MTTKLNIRYLPKITQSLHSIETGKDQDMQLDCVKECKSSGIPAKHNIIPS